ncbi:hypothetical protein AUJ14_01485 [Candidatus Micrarchaeota archaeon CG1_02_55_22]|nr:MAG: hypothetical protein AUJ14_01485 [Candidatus Micrarchaeota archaeon CG1_02_55_22]
MDVYEQKFADYCKSKKLFFQPLYFEASTHSVADAAKAANCTEKDLVKNLCLLTRSGGLVVAILRGDSRLDKAKLEQLVGERLSFCSAEQVLEKTGYPAGGVPSLGLTGRIFIDALIVERDVVLCGGGSSKSLARVRADDIIDDCGAVVADLALAVTL